MNRKARIVFHLDDVGSSAGSVKAWRDLRRAGCVTTASAMVPCPWYPAVADDYREDPGQDLGIHLTLTSEWSHYRWRPMSSGGGGLVDDEGYFHRRPESVARFADLRAVEDEMRAQVERALSDGIRPTHLDAHMGTAYLERFLPALFRVADEYGIPPALFRNIGSLASDVGISLESPLDAPRHFIEEAKIRGWPVLDHFLIRFCPGEAEAETHFSDLVASAPPGTHWLALHANAEDDMRVFAPDTYAARVKEYELFRQPGTKERFRAICQVSNWREVLEQRIP
ncbi:MAG: ChbG/HpnK family deacetylase [Albidovulum sp.]|nr:ChbG/HpnK family deacetylase [Albidovulum sp.]MDE0304840.1 ChbG/HpnK family deacetylase [Albidovulum sp.]